MLMRLADENDIDQLIKMRWDFTFEYSEVIEEVDEDFLEFDRECRTFLEAALKSKDWFIWIADRNGQIISHVYVELVHKVPRPGRVTHPFVYMTNVYTLPAYRGRGIASQLFKKIEDWAKCQKYEFIIVWPSEWSIDFYEQNGYKHCKAPMELSLD
ncbi:GNAT family N-acetyltransferase [Paenibacillus sp. N1-5-1-14]|uniref:GNAT family N-acetyltransferase n=1 Tax=Paenibacillus radicibacter TaxID=2972488 RepID=UPI0021590E3A|nr:GNAT family N-acetyltransferase [Paenibacillus radicibacter]MCR8644442.1 GNAT family N-acetyltransferase [Paenibacillus radicibacter]